MMLVFTSMFLLYWSVSRVGFYSAVLRQKDLLNMSCKSLMLVIPCRRWPSALAMVIIGIGDTPAIVALFLASLLPIVRNTYAGLCSVPASLIEAANGIGMTKWQRLRQVELPNAWPVMLSVFASRPPSMSAPRRWPF
ncbi:ABC transporter permease subunit [Salmonella enterica subsp. enterica serovar Senftenberg]|nr:ABC transporter permease subunit [Salmonella enterica subsp. enterica serovar Senftenberg]